MSSSIGSSATWEFSVQLQSLYWYRGWSSDNEDSKRDVAYIHKPFTGNLGLAQILRVEPSSSLGIVGCPDDKEPQGEKDATMYKEFAAVGAAQIPVLSCFFFDTLADIRHRPFDLFIVSTQTISSRLSESHVFSSISDLWALGKQQ
ncbi:hypothetical protein HGRIS_004569 [Hohenbuehelia grisea]|uniref:Uncharacterized protein n=1 Tax=Hohenbuehelia grisea TaxID=104357 RepID=A0ABR3JCC7_9AGAR